MTIVVAMAHPDDAEIFCAGTIAHLQQTGLEVVIVTMTAGGLGSYSQQAREIEPIRIQEATDAASKVGASYTCLHIEDGFVFDTAETRKVTIECLRRLQADLVITHLPDDYHPDHRATSRIVEAACLLSTLPNVPIQCDPLLHTPALYHAAPLNLVNHLGTPFSPSFGVDISKNLDLKRRMISAHTSQVALMRQMFQVHHFVEEMLDAHDRKLGTHFGVPYAEGFLQHLGGGFPTEPVLQDLLAPFIVQ